MPDADNKVVARSRRLALVLVLVAVVFYVAIIVAKAHF
jgi:hypothetical protein